MLVTKTSLSGSLKQELSVVKNMVTNRYSALETSHFFETLISMFFCSIKFFFFFILNERNTLIKMIKRKIRKLHID